jgi:hypothetical protein
MESAQGKVWKIESHTDSDFVKGSNGHKRVIGLVS